MSTGTGHHTGGQAGISIVAQVDSAVRASTYQKIIVLIVITILVVIVVVVITIIVIVIAIIVTVIAIAIVIVVTILVVIVVTTTATAAAKAITTTTTVGAILAQAIDAATASCGWPMPTLLMTASLMRWRC